ncbi:MAG TPA: hypothetical protein VFJ47_06285 [Terriglobales bacterium]|nr:hypothetical protein [Terriglobales bacterium]
MKKIAAILAGLMALTLPGLAQKIASPSDAQLKTVAWQDQDDRKPQGDQDDRDRKDREKDKKDRDRKDRDRDDRDRDRARSDRDNNRGDNDRDRDNGQYQDRDRNGGYYGNGQYGDRDRDRNGGYYGDGQYGRSYHNVLAPEWQQKFDSYYQRWQQYRATNNTGEMRSMEQRMQDIMAHYNIPSNVPYDQVASPGVGGYQNRY